ncbi:hypothetical protein JHK87_045834 [Glycine soja]|nr:hypothetical protein JHK87_045834 [Glycine soja]
MTQSKETTMLEAKKISCGKSEVDFIVIDKSFGFDTAVEEAQGAINFAHVEAESTENGIDIVKLMGRYSGLVCQPCSLRTYLKNRQEEQESKAAEGVKIGMAGMFGCSCHWQWAEAKSMGMGWLLMEPKSLKFQYLHTTTLGKSICRNMAESCALKLHSLQSIIENRVNSDYRSQKNKRRTTVFDNQIARKGCRKKRQKLGIIDKALAKSGLEENHQKKLPRCVHRRYELKKNPEEWFCCYDQAFGLPPSFVSQGR